MSLTKFVLLLVVAVSGCSGGNSLSPEVAQGIVDTTMTSSDAGVLATIELRYDDPTVFQDLEFHWLTLADSRCPTGVTCVWAGQMIATVEIKHSTQGTTEVELLRRAGREPAVTYAFEYDLRLLDVIPHPKNNVTPDRREYLMRIEIRRP